MSNEIMVDEKAASIIAAVARAKGITFEEALLFICDSFAEPEKKAV